MSSNPPGWSKTLQVGVEVIDRPNKRLFSLVEDMRAIVEGDGGFDDVMAVLWEISGIIHSHFAEEERILEATRYPFFDLHKLSHTAISIKLQDIIENLEQGGGGGREVYDFLRGWLHHHIEIEDGDYREHLAAHLDKIQ